MSSAPIVDLPAPLRRAEKKETEISALFAALGALLVAAAAALSVSWFGRVT